MPNWYLGAVLCIAPFFIKIAPQMIHANSWWFYLKIISILSACLYGFAVKRKEVLIATLCVVATCFVSVNPYGIYEFVHMDATLSGLLFFAFIMGQRVSASAVYGSLAFICLAQCLWLWVEHLGINPFMQYLSAVTSVKAVILKPDSYTVNGSLGHINHSAALIAATIPFINKKFWIIPVITLGIFGSALPIFCGLLAMAIVLAHKFGRVKYVIFAVALAASVSVLFDASIIGTNERLKVWRFFQSWTDISLFGQGFGIIPSRFAQVAQSALGGERFLSLHNELLEIYAIFGIIGVICAGYLLKSMFLKPKYPEVHACALVILVNALGNFSFHVAPIFIIFITCYALLIQSGEKQDGSNNGKKW